MQMTLCHFPELTFEAYRYTRRRVPRLLTTRSPDPGALWIRSSHNMNILPAILRPRTPLIYRAFHVVRGRTLIGLPVVLLRPLQEHLHQRNGRELDERGLVYAPTPILTIEWSGIVDIPTYHVTGMNRFPL